jgi:hypothetical protein
MALLRGELEITCFYFLHRLAHVVYAAPGAADMSSNRKSFSGSPLASFQRGGKGQGQKDEGLAEEEAILLGFNEHLQQYFQAVISSSSPDALAALLSPLCSVVPRILTHCAMHMVSESDKGNDDDDDSLTHSVMADHYLKTHLLRMVVSVQQSTAMHIQAHSIQLETKRRLMDLLTDGFERSRRFITMVSMPAAELKVCSVLYHAILYCTPLLLYLVAFVVLFICDTMRCLAFHLSGRFYGSIPQYIYFADTMYHVRAIYFVQAYLKGNTNDYSKEEVEILWLKSPDR